MKNIFDNLDVATKIAVINKLTEISAKVDLIYDVQQLTYVPYSKIDNIVNYDDIWYLIENLQTKLNLYIVENGLQNILAERYIPPKYFFTLNETNVIILISKIYRLLDQIFPEIPQVLQLNLHNYIKLAQREGTHMPKFRDMAQEFINKIHYNFVSTLNKDFYNSSTVTDDGADYLAGQLGLYLPMDDSGRPLLSLAEKRLTIKLAEFYTNWGGTIHETNEMLGYVFKDFGRAWVELDENNKTNRINIFFEHPPRKFLLDYWRDAGLLPPERVGFKGIIVAVGDAPIGFNKNYRNLLTGTARFGFNKDIFAEAAKITKFKQLKYAFAENGEKEEIPIEKQASGEVSFEEGFPPLYETAYQAGGLTLDRKHLNYLFNKLFEAYKFWQRNSMFEWTEDTDKPNSLKSFRVKYKGQVYQRLADVDYDGKTPDESAAYDLINYKNSLSVSQLKKIYDLFYWEGDTFDALYGVTDYIENQSGEQYKNHLTNYNSSKKSSIEYNGRLYSIKRPNIDGYFTIVNDDRMGSPSQYTSEKIRLNDWTVKDHDHKVELDELNETHQHPSKNKDIYFTKKEKPDVSAGDYTFNWLFMGNSVIRRSYAVFSSEEGDHTHEIIQKNNEDEEKELYPNYVSMEKITIFQKISDNAFTPKFEPYTKKSANFTSYGSKNNYATEIPIEVGDVNFKEGFTSIYENGTLTKGLTLYAFNGLIKLYSLFVEQVINKGYVDHEAGNVYDYGCRVKSLQKIYISLVDNNTNTDFTNRDYWIDETYIVRNKIDANILPPGTVHPYLVPRYRLRYRSNSDDKFKNYFYELTPHAATYTWVDPESPLGKIMNGNYKDNLLPLLGGGCYIRTRSPENIKISELRDITKENFGVHIHEYSVSKEGKHKHEVRGYSTINSWNYHRVEYIYSTADNNRHPVGAAGEHVHKVRSQTAGDGSELVLDNVSARYLVQK